ncbi:LAFE_0C01662g1_1 [Lachancea fermentati]|uniref:LAFE_0C01662g1_1 n=1 Tax=Lachancea fermentati TaxID=4955 RepID=A0A1G4M9A0_LACFM|nr:LAFE_0C01662g1_1 [Lachancea fermentati]
MLRYRATRTFRRPQVGESLLKTLHERSINEYALNFSPFLYMLLNIREFPLLMECFGEEDDVYDEVELQDDLSDEITVEEISRIFIRMLQDEDELGTILEIMVRLTAFDLRAERGTSEDADENEEDEPSEEDHALESHDSTDSHPVLPVAGRVGRTYSYILKL